MGDPGATRRIGSAVIHQAGDLGPFAGQRHHLDLYATDQNAEVDRLTGLGARSVDWIYEEDADYVVLADPDGNQFCVIDASEEG